jgi:hypothetical protein
MSRRRAREEEEEEEKEGELSPEQQLKLNNDMLDTCWSGTVADVRRLLREGAHVNAVGVVAQTGLILACRRRDWDVAFPLVTLLLSKGFSIRTFDDHGGTHCMLHVGTPQPKLCSCCSTRILKCGRRRP